MNPVPGPGRYYIEYVGGAWPTQAWGRTREDRPYYFRAQNSHWSLEIGEPGWVTRYTDWPVHDGDQLLGCGRFDATDLDGMMTDADIIKVLDDHLAPAETGRLAAQIIDLWTQTARGALTPDQFYEAVGVCLDQGGGAATAATGLRRNPAATAIGALAEAVAGGGLPTEALLAGLDAVQPPARGTTQYTGPST